jgi:hypothetical protein
MLFQVCAPRQTSKASPLSIMEYGLEQSADVSSWFLMRNLKESLVDDRASNMHTR